MSGLTNIIQLASKTCMGGTIGPSGTLVTQRHNLTGSKDDVLAEIRLLSINSNINSRQISLEKVAGIYKGTFKEYRLAFNKVKLLQKSNNTSNTNALAQAKAELADKTKSWQSLRKELRTYFNKMIGQKGLRLDSFEDLEQLFTDNTVFSDTEFLPALYLYMQANFESSDENNHQHFPPKTVFESKTMDCDDNAFFIYYLATKRGLAQNSSCDWLLVGDRALPKPDIHVVYLFKTADRFISIDNWDYDVSKCSTKTELMKTPLFKYVFAARTIKAPLELAHYLPECLATIDDLTGSNYQLNQTEFYFIRTRDK